MALRLFGPALTGVYVMTTSGVRTILQYRKNLHPASCIQYPYTRPMSCRHLNAAMTFLCICCIVMVNQALKIWAEEPLASNTELVVSEPFSQEFLEEGCCLQKKQAVKLSAWISFTSSFAPLVVLLVLSLLILRCYSVISGRRKSVDGRRLSSAAESECINVPLSSENPGQGTNTEEESEETQRQGILDSSKGAEGESVEDGDNGPLKVEHVDSTTGTGTVVAVSASERTSQQRVGYPKWWKAALCATFYCVMVILILTALLTSNFSFEKCSSANSNATEVNTISNVSLNNSATTSSYNLTSSDLL